MPFSNSLTNISKQDAEKVIAGKTPNLPFQDPSIMTETDADTPGIFDMCWCDGCSGCGPCFGCGGCLGCGTCTSCVCVHNGGSPTDKKVEDPQ